jgi:hypothetical protein
MKEYSKKHYEENIERYKARSAASNKKLRLRNRDYIKNIKESNPCLDCGKKYPYYVMHSYYAYPNKRPRTLKAEAMQIP